MAVDIAAKKAFNNQIAEQKKLVNEMEKDVSMYKKAFSQEKKLKAFFQLSMASKYLQQINLYLDMNDLSEKLMNFKNSSYLDNARKLISKIFSELEQVVTMGIDEPLNHNKEQLMKIKPFNPKQRLNLFLHIKKSIDRLIKSYGENTKWKWSFPEINGKLAIIAKNFMDYRELQKIRDPNEQFYYDRQELLKIIKESLFEASNQYRDKFELSTKSVNDLLYAIRLLEDLRRISSLTGDPDLVKKSKSGIESYQTRLESIEKEKEKKKKKK
ncbi:MAG: hypothetical protein OEZ22_00435 [Spirochaetia bacterium]|nr:hypothetical protein [Spirochaetia bacterium]